MPLPPPLLKGGGHIVFATDPVGVGVGIGIGGSVGVGVGVGVGVKTSCPLCNFNTLLNILMELDRNVGQDETTCRVQEWLS